MCPMARLKKQSFDGDIFPIKEIPVTENNRQKDIFRKEFERKKKS